MTDINGNDATCGRHRMAAVAYAFAGDAQRRLRGARPRLGLRPSCRGDEVGLQAPRCCGEVAAVRGPQRHDAVQGCDARALRRGRCRLRAWLARSMRCTSTEKAR